MDRERLKLVSGYLSQLTAEACSRAGIRPGAHAIDVGCGQMGALPVSGEMVGPSGVVVGLDDSPDALAAARAGLASLGLHTVHLVEATSTHSSPTCSRPGRRATLPCVVCFWCTSAIPPARCAPSPV